MHSRFPAGWRFTLWTAVLATLILLPCLTASAASSNGITKVVGDKVNGLQAVDRQHDDGAPSPVAFARSNYVWPYAVGPSYGEVDLAARQAPGVLQTAVGSFRLGRGELNIPAELKTTDRLSELGVQYFVVAIERQASSTETAALIEQNGGAVVAWMPVSAMVARLTPAAMSALQGLSAVIAVEPYHPAFKLDPSIGRVPLNDPVKALSEVYDLDVRVFEGESAEAVAEAVSRLGGNVVAVFPDTVRVELNRSMLAELAALQPVQMVWENLPLQPHSEETTTTMQTGRWNLGATPYNDANIDGSGGGIAAGQVLMVLDTGIQLDAGDLSDTRIDAGTAGASHRKVLRYDTTLLFGGSGDLLGCDAPAQGGFTHGHMVSAVAMGNGSRVDPSYGDGWEVLDQNDTPWKVDGVAPGAKLVHFDGQYTPAAVSCADPLYAVIGAGDLYSAPTSGSLYYAYMNDGARTFNFSWGSDSNSYSANTVDIDVFLATYRDAMVFVSAGNYGLDQEPEDGFPDEGSLGTLATTKNGLAIGASRNADDLGVGGQEEARAFWSSVGPTATGNRTAPLLMAPGDEANGGDMGLASEFGCRSSDNDQSNPVECDVVTGIEGTSFSAPAAAGAGLLVRDYFAQGYYPDGTSANLGNSGDQVPNISGALVKAILIASADFMTGINTTWLSRFNNEQGYGRIQLDQALPLQSWPPSPPGLIVADGGIVGGKNSLSGTVSGVIATNATVTQSSTFEVCSGSDELRVALAWIEPSGNSLINDIDLELQSPAGEVYYGNYFTDDNNRSRALEAGEDCPSLDGTPLLYDAAEWSLPATGCVNAIRDTVNLTEAIMLSPDYDGDGENDLDPADDNQIEVGTWTVFVKSKSVGNTATQRYALAIAGGVCLGSAARFDSSIYACNSRATITVNEVAETGDMTPDTAAVAGRVTVQVLDPSDVVVDEELGTDLPFTQPDPPALTFVAENVILTDGTAYDPGNGVLDVRSGDRVHIIYEDVDTSGLPDPYKVRKSTAKVDCDPRITFGDIVFAGYGQDASFFVTGGCETNLRGWFEFGFPDKYMDAQELISYNFAFGSAEDIDLVNAEVNLRCVVADLDSPEECRPGSDDCADPDRLNNASCDGTGDGDPVYMTILDTPKTIGLIPAGAAIAANFSIQMEPTIADRPEVDMILEVTSRTAGKTSTGLAINRHQLDVDENNVFYSTDWPTGGTEVRDINNNEIEENPTYNIGNWLADYRFETMTWSDLTAGGTKNMALQSPWKFDANDGGFTVGLTAVTDEASIGDVIAQWGEDKNFNGLNDGYCSLKPTVHCYNDADCAAVSGGVCNSIEDRDPVNDLLDRSWGTLGGCGWQTKGATATTGGIWHTGRIYGTSGTCLVSGNDAGQCQGYETVSGSSGQLLWMELLVTPVIQKVNGDDYKIEITDWAWNQAIDIADSNASWTWELDTDITKLEPADLKSDGTTLNGGNGGYGAVVNENNPDLTNGFSVFAPVKGTCRNHPTVICTSNAQCTMTCNDGITICASDDDCKGGTNYCDLCTNATDSLGKLGRNRTPRNSCFFVGPAGIKAAAMATLGVPKPLDDDIDNDTDGAIDEYVELNGPIRNMDIFAFNGPDMRWSTLEDIYGDTGDFFQAAIGMVTFEKFSATEPDPQTSYGVGVDDMVIQWREFNFVDDATDCGAEGECAVIDLATSNMFEGNALLTITVLEKSPPAENDCDWDSSGDGTTDCDSDGVPDLVVKATSANEIAGEIVFANQVTGSANEYKADLPISAVYNAPGVLFIQPQGLDNPVVNVLYMDMNILPDGAGGPCINNPDPAAWGRVENGTFVFLARGQVVLKKAVLSDNGDNDAWADTNETVTMRIELLNSMQVDLSGISARLSTNDPKIDCITNPAIEFGDLAKGQAKLSTSAFEFKVGDIQREGTCKDGGTPCTVDAQCDPADFCTAYLQDYSVVFYILLKSNEFDATLAPQTLTVDLDLDASGGTLPGVFFEGFESGTFGSMTTMNLDFGRNSEEASEGYRCQYTDPDWFWSNSYEQISDCWLAATAAQADQFFWQISNGMDTAVPGRSYSGQYSVYMGVYDDANDDWTTPMATLEGLATDTPMNIGVGKVCSETRTTQCVADGGCPEGEVCETVSPELSFKYQVSYADFRCVNTSGAGRSADGGAIGYQFVNPDGSAASVWLKLEPYTNYYDSQKEDNYVNCFFDPVDDGNTEDDFFDPSDPQRRLGPSTMCFPNFSYCNVGSTVGTYSPNNVGNGDAGSGLEGNMGEGTWVESRLNLDRFLGRRIKIRFINSSIKAGTAETMEDFFKWNPEPCDDGWWVDDIQITDALLGDPATVTADVKNNSALPLCGDVCNTVTAILEADPATALAAPGQVVELSGAPSYANRCMNGTLQYRFWIDGDGDSSGGGAADELVRGWTDNPFLVQAPTATTTYVMDTRCSALTSCADSTHLEVVVDCPASGTLVTEFPDIYGEQEATKAPGDLSLCWGSVTDYEYVRGLLSTLDTSYTYNQHGTGTGDCLFVCAEDPAPGEGYWYLFKAGAAGGGFCNQIRTYGSTARDVALP